MHDLNQEPNRQPPGNGGQEVSWDRSEGFEGIHCRYSKRVYSLCLRMTSSRRKLKTSWRTAIVRGGNNASGGTCPVT